ncbi:MAG TPA: DUF485 domain-containing protein [Woeseiaceae bacterium]|nr:DUF485 domain-containing protein [Woeseiaceae bacterium]
MTTDIDALLQSPAVRRLLLQRSRLRWRLAGLLLGAYLAYAFAGLHATDAMGQPVFGSGVNRAITAGYGIILLAIATSLYYLYAVNRLLAPLKELLRKANS